MRGAIDAIDAIDEAFGLHDADDHPVFWNGNYRRIHAASADAIVAGAPFEGILRDGVERGQYAAAAGLHRVADTAHIPRQGDGRTVRIIERRMPEGHLVGFRIDFKALTPRQADHAAGTTPSHVRCWGCSTTSSTKRRWTPAR